MPEQVTKASILKELSTSYTALEELLASLDEKYYLRQGVIPGWSIKDILAHINSWHHRLLSLLNAAIHNEKPSLVGPDSVEELDKLNAEFYQENKSLPLNEVLADFHTSYQHIFDITQAMPEEDLINPHTYAWTHGQPLWQSIAGDTYEHYQEHLIQIQQWLVKSEQI
jgi:hypothetical protein